MQTTAEILYCVHGFLGQASDWEDILPPYLRKFAFDLFSPGASSQPAFDFNALGGWINDTAVKSPGPRVLVGYSLGGRIALHALTRKPEIWSAAVIISAHPGLSDPTERQKRIENDEKWAE